MAAIERESLAQVDAAPMDHGAARERLIKRVHELSKQHGFSFNRILIKNQKTRWGSCSDKNNINLNINLVRLPEHLIDYTILHELVHTRIKNHGEAFWAALEKMVAGAKHIDKQLNQYRLVPAGGCRNNDKRLMAAPKDKQHPQR